MAKLTASTLDRGMLCHPCLSPFQGKPKIKHRPRCGRFMPLMMTQSGKTVYFSSELSTDLPLYESAKVPFGSYLSDKERIFQAIFPDKRRSEKLNEEEWRIHMLPIQFLFLTAYPVIDMSIVVKAPGKGYPHGVSKDVQKVLTLEAKRWNLRGLGYELKESEFLLSVRGALYAEADKHGSRSRLRGQMDMSVTFLLPPMLAFVPQDILQSVGRSVLIRLLENMKERVNQKILSDYRQYAMEKGNANTIWREGHTIEPVV